MTDTIANKVIEWADSNKINIDKDILLSSELSGPHTFNDVLVCALKSAGHFWRDAYEGLDPDAFFPQIINGALSLITDGDVKLESLSSNDDWQSAVAVINNKGVKTELTIDNVGGYDLEYAPSELHEALIDYSKDHFSKSLEIITCDESYVYLYVSNESVNELQAIINQIPSLGYS